MELNLEFASFTDVTSEQFGEGTFDKRDFLMFQFLETLLIIPGVHLRRPGAKLTENILCIVAG